jgi:hypothetical protein
MTGPGAVPCPAVAEIGRTKSWTRNRETRNMDRNLLMGIPTGISGPVYKVFTVYRKDMKD